MYKQATLPVGNNRTVSVMARVSQTPNAPGSDRGTKLGGDNVSIGKKFQLRSHFPIIFI